MPMAYGRPAVAMNVTWATLAFLTCLTPPEWGLRSATLLMTGFTHASFSAALYILDRDVICGQGTKKGV
jgi:hypothetical protein